MAKKKVNQEPDGCHCINCGRELPLNSIFCNWCGERQIAEKKQEIQVPKPTKMPSGRYLIVLRKEKWSASFDTEEEAVSAARLVRTGYIERAKVCEVIKLKDAIDRYIEVRSNVLSPSTIRGYYQIKVNRFPELMEMYVGDIDVTAAQKAINDQVAKGSSPKTVLSSWRFVKTVINEIHPVTYNVKLPQMLQKDRPFLDEKQLKIFLEVIHGKDIELFCLLALHSLRLSEIYALTWDDIDMANKCIHVHGACVRNKDGEYVLKKENKNLSSRRDIPIIIPRMEEVVKEADKSKPICPMKETMAWHRLNDVVKDNDDLPNISPHCLRHTFASLALTTLNMPESVVMKMGGWSTPNTMKKIYRHTSDMEVSKQADEMRKYFGKAEKKTDNASIQTSK